MDARAVIELIRAAFPVLPLPEMSLHQAHLANYSLEREISKSEWEAAGRLDAGRGWREFRDEELIACDAALAHLDEPSFVYYVPAFLEVAVRHCHEPWPNPADALVGTVVFSVTHRTPYTLARFKRLSPEQREAVVAFLEFIVKQGHSHESERARKALVRYWKTAEAAKPLIVVP